MAPVQQQDRAENFRKEPYRLGSPEAPPLIPAGSAVEFETSRVGRKMESVETQGLGDPK
jgi:hypothetical protein